MEINELGQISYTIDDYDERGLKNESKLLMNQILCSDLNSTDIEKLLGERND